MLSNNIPDNLEMDQVEYLDTLLCQLQDNMDALDKVFGQYEATQTQDDLVQFLYEYRRLSRRNESMMNLSKTLLDVISDNLEESRQSLNELTAGNY